MDPRWEQWRNYRPRPRVQPSQPQQYRHYPSNGNGQPVRPVHQPNQGQQPRQTTPRKGCCGG